MDNEIKKEEPKNDINNIDDMKNILQKLVEQNEENHRLLKKIRSYQNLQTVIFYLKILIIVVPIIWGIIYLPAILKPFWNGYLQGIGVDTNTSLDLQNLQKTLNSLRQQP